MATTFPVRNVSITGTSALNGAWSAQHTSYMPVIRLSDDTLLTASTLSADPDAIRFWYSTDEGDSWTLCSTAWDVIGSEEPKGIVMDRTPDDVIFIANGWPSSLDLSIARISFSGSDITVEDDHLDLTPNATEVMGIMAIDHPVTAGNWFVTVMTEEGANVKLWMFDWHPTTGGSDKAQILLRSAASEGGGRITLIHNGDRYTPLSASAPTAGVIYTSNDDYTYYKKLTWNGTSGYWDTGTEYQQMWWGGTMDNLAEMFWVPADSKMWMFVCSNAYNASYFVAFSCDADGQNYSASGAQPADPSETLFASVNWVYDPIQDKFYLAYLDTTVTPDACYYNVYDRNGDSWGGWTLAEDTVTWYGNLGQGNLGFVPPTFGGNGSNLSFIYVQASTIYGRIGGIEQIEPVASGFGWGWIPI